MNGTRWFENRILKYLVASVIVAIAGIHIFAQQPGPHLSIDLSPAQLITVTQMDPTSIGACTVFTSRDEMVDGSVYAPRHCWITPENEPMTTYIDNWDWIPTGHSYDVSAEVFVPDPSSPDDDDAVTTVLTNVVKNVYHAAPVALAAQK